MRITSSAVPMGEAARADVTGGVSSSVKGVHVLYTLIAFFVVVIVVNVVFLRFALSSFPGEEIEGSYYNGLGYGQEIAARQAQHQAGWRFSVLAQPAAEQAGQIIIRVTMNDRAITSETMISGRLIRAATEEGAIDLEFRRAADGTYTSNTPALAPGRWNFSLEASDADTGARLATAETRMMFR